MRTKSAPHLAAVNNDKHKNNTPMNTAINLRNLSDRQVLDIVKKNAAIGPDYRTAKSIAIGMAAIRECIRRGI